MTPRPRMEAPTTNHSRALFSLLLCAALLSGLVIQTTDSRPALHRRDKGDDRFDDSVDHGFGDEENLFPGLSIENYTISTHPAPTENPPGSCYTEVNRTFGGYTQTVRVCCEGWQGEDCDEREDVASGAGGDQYPFDPTSPCRNLQCEGNPDAYCAVVTKCGRNLPLFFDTTGRLARCNNEDFIDGQPVDLVSLTCTGVCRDNPCKSQTCAEHPEAMCFISGCDCKPIWLLDTGVQVDCSSGEIISPERPRRSTSTSNCS